MVMARVRASEGGGSRDCPLSTSSGFPEEAVKDSVPLLIVGGPSGSLRRCTPKAGRYTPSQETFICKHRGWCPTITNTRPERGIPVATQDHVIRLRQPSIDDRVHQGEQGSLLLWLRGLILIAVGYQ